MLIVALVLAVIGLASLVTAVVTGNELIAWVCIGASVLGVILLIIDAIRERQTRSAAAVDMGADDAVIATPATVDNTYENFDAEYPEDSAAPVTAEPVTAEPLAAERLDEPADVPEPDASDVPEADVSESDVAEAHVPETDVPDADVPDVAADEPAVDTETEVHYVSSEDADSAIQVHYVGSEEPDTSVEYVTEAEPADELKDQ